MLAPSDTFVHRHIGPSEGEVREMLAALGAGSVAELIDQTVPRSIRFEKRLGIGPGSGEFELLQQLRTMAERNAVLRSCIGMGYYDTITPPVIQRTILEESGVVHAVHALSGGDFAGAAGSAAEFSDDGERSDGAAAGERFAAGRSDGGGGGDGHVLAYCRAAASEFFIAEDCHPQTIAVVRARAKAQGIECVVGPAGKIDFAGRKFCGILLQYPATDGAIADYSSVISAAHAAGAMAVVAADILALTLLKPPGEFGADIAVGSTQRFGVPMGFGGPHAAYLATRSEFARKMPGRSSAFPKIRRGNRRIDWRFRRASSISGATRRRAISVRHRCCWR
jgi:glycine dehydrogenase